MVPNRGARAPLAPLGADAAGSWAADRPTPISLLDRALSILRRASLDQWLRGLSAPLPLAAAMLGAYYLERVEGVRTPLWLFGLLAALAYVWRFARLSRLSRELVQSLAPGLPLTAAAPRGIDWVATAVIAGVGACVWAAWLLLMGRVSVFLVFAFLPLTCVRGLIAPSLLARAACAPERGLRAFRLARADTHGARSLMLGLCLLESLCVLFLFANVYALAALLMLFAGSVLGLDVAFIGAFLSPDNELVLMCLLGLAAVLLEPLHAASSALAFASARERKEGADLHAAIDALARTESIPVTPPRSAARATGALLCLLLCCGSALAFAEPPPVSTPSRTPEDAAVRERVQRILQGHEFRELSPQGDQAFRLWDWLMDLLRKQDTPERGVISAPHFELRVPASMVVLLALLFLVVVVGFVSKEVRRTPAAVPPRAQRPGPSLPPAQRSLDEQLSEAARLARAGAYAEALRALHAASLVLVVRSAGQRFDASRTDGQYLRALPSGPLRDGFEHISASFERSWYGKLPITQAEYERAEAGVQLLLRAAAPRSTPPEART